MPPRHPYPPDRGPEVSSWEAVDRPISPWRSDGAPPRQSASTGRSILITVAAIGAFWRGAGEQGRSLPWWPMKCAAMNGTGGAAGHHCTIRAVQSDNTRSRTAWMACAVRWPLA